jgi:hypothetical protein
VRTRSSSGSPSLTLKRAGEGAVYQSLLEVVERYRRAARTVIEADRPRSAKNLALIDLAKCARAEETRETTRWAELAVWKEAERFFYPDEPPEEADDAISRAARSMRSRGLVRCTHCYRPLLTDLELEMTARASRRWYLDRRIHREAVG